MRRAESPRRGASCSSRAHLEWQDRARAEVLDVCGDSNGDVTLDFDAVAKMRTPHAALLQKSYPRRAF